jgi:uncharacterized linocin/CFP29 family protein
MHTWKIALFHEGEVTVTENGERNLRPTLTQALDAVLDRSELDNVEIKRVEVDVMGTGDVIFRIYPRDGSESERSVVTP